MEFLKMLSSVVTLNLYAVILSGVKFNFKLTGVFLVLETCLLYGLGDTFIISDMFLGITLVLLMISFLMYQGVNVFLSILYSIVSMLVGVLSDTMVAAGMSIFLGIDSVTYVELIKKIPAIYFVFFLFLFLWGCVLATIISKIMHAKHLFEGFNYRNKYGYLLITVLVITFLVIYASAFQIGFSLEEYKFTLILFFAYIFVLIIIFNIIFSSYIREQKTKNIQKQMSQLIEYTTNLESLYNEMRVFRHDYVNILASMAGYMDDEDLEGLKKHFYKNVLPQSKLLKAGTFKLGRLANIKITEIKGILSSKLIRAQELGIDVEIDVAEPIETICINMISICRIVGILLDNATEGALEAEVPKINLGVIRKKSSVLFVIENSCKKDMPPIYKLFEEGFSTKGENRGLGLYSIRETLKDYNNCYLDTTIEEGMFKQVLSVSELI